MSKLETASAGEINFLIRTFRQTGCRDMELAHLNETDLLDSKEIYIREEPCRGGKDCRSRGNVWRPKTRRYAQDSRERCALRRTERTRQRALVPERPRQGGRPPASQAGAILTSPTSCATRSNRIDFGRALDASDAVQRQSRCHPRDFGK